MKYLLTKLFVLIALQTAVFAQSIQEQLTVRQPDCRDVLVNTGELLPKLYVQKSFDSIGVAIVVVQQYCPREPEELFYLTLLLHIQRSTFSVDRMSDNYYFSRIIHTERYGLPIPLLDVVNQSQFYYSFGNWSLKLNQLIKTWANDLLSKPNLSNNEYFICNVLAGNYKHPESILKNEKDKYPQLFALLNQQLQKERSEPIGVFNILIGTWIPAGNLRLLGTHPTVGFQLGGRNQRNEFLLDLHVRFLKAANSYTVRRADSTYRLSYYTGFYIGAEYIRYFYHSLHFETGLVGGLGYDGFSITGSSDKEEEYLKPVNIGSPNINAGLRINYFFNPRLCLGIIGKYNAIWYKNRGGTNLSGHPFSIDVVLGR